MARFETPIEDQRVAKTLEGLDLQSVQLARNAEQLLRLTAFIDQYANPETLERVAPDGQTHVYRHTRLNAIGEDGSLLHIRLHEQTLGQPVDPSIREIAVISHIDDPNPAYEAFATSELITRFDSSTQTKFTIGQPDTQNLQLVDRPMNELQWNVEEALLRERALASVPIVALTGNGWEYRRSDGHWEKLGHLLELQKRVSVALSRGLGYAALPEARSEISADYGQFEQKMVV